LLTGASCIFTGFPGFCIGPMISGSTKGIGPPRLIASRNLLIPPPDISGTRAIKPPAIQTCCCFQPRPRLGP
jgi:hypothetical protein